MCIIPFIVTNSRVQYSQSYLFVDSFYQVIQNNGYQSVLHYDCFFRIWYFSMSLNNHVISVKTSVHKLLDCKSRELHYSSYLLFVLCLCVYVFTY